MLIVYRCYRDFFVVIFLISLTLFVLHMSAGVYNFCNIRMLRMVRQGSGELQIFSNIKMWLKGLIQYVFFISSSVRLSDQGFVPKTRTINSPIILELFFTARLTRICAS